VVAPGFGGVDECLVLAGGQVDLLVGEVVVFRSSEADLGPDAGRVMVA